MNKLAQHIDDELRRIAFFLQYAGVIEDHFPKGKNKTLLLNLPVVWDDQHVLINGKKPSEVNDDDYIETIGLGQRLPVSLELKGKVKNAKDDKHDDFTLKIVFGDREHQYSLEFEDGTSYGTKKKIRSMQAIADIINKKSEGETHEDKDIENMYQALFNRKSKYNALKDEIISKFFGDYKDLGWNAFVQKQSERGQVLFQIYTENANPQEYKKVFSLFTQDDPERATFKLTDLLKSEITNYVGNKIQDAGFDAEPSIRGVMKPKVDGEGNLSGKLGFTITIK